MDDPGKLSFAPLISWEHENVVVWKQASDSLLCVQVSVICPVRQHQEGRREDDLRQMSREALTALFLSGNTHNT